LTITAVVAKDVQNKVSYAIQTAIDSCGRMQAEANVIGLSLGEISNVAAHLVACIRIVARSYKKASLHVDLDASRKNVEYVASRFLLVQLLISYSLAGYSLCL